MQRQKSLQKKAFERAKLTPSDIDILEVHDCFTIAEIMAIEDMGFCKKGEGGKITLDGDTSRDGLIPVNMSGGLKSKGHPIGATGQSQLVELFKQLNGLAEKKTD